MQSTSLKLRDFPLPSDSGTILCDTSTSTPRPYVPSAFRHFIFDKLHNLSHPGIRATQQLISQRYVWPSMQKDIRNWTRSCLQCQKSKVQRHTVSPLGTFTTPDAWFDHVHIDIVGPLPSSNGFHYLVTYVDQFTRWPEAIPIPDILAETVARAFVSRWIANFGLPSTVTTDRGSQFKSSLFKHLTTLLGVKHIHTTAYHPCANGMVERFHRQLKASIKSYPNPSAWTEILPLVLLSIRSTFKPDIDCTPAQLVYGTTLRLPGQFFAPNTTNADLDPTIYSHRLQSAMAKLRPVSLRQQPTSSHVPSDFTSCTHVFVRHDAVRKPLRQPYDGPFKILHRSDKHFTLAIKDKPQTISLDRLKPAHLEADLVDTAVCPPPPTVPAVPPPSSSDTLQSSTNAPSIQPPAPTPHATRSGRRVHFPQRFGFDTGLSH